MSAIGLLGGTGIEGRAIATRLANVGIEVAIGSRSSKRAREIASQINKTVQSEAVKGLDNDTVFRQCQTLFLTLPFEAAPSFLKENSSRFLAGHVLVDVTVPLRFEKGPRLIELPEGSASEHLRQLVPQPVPLVATFKTLPAHLLADLHQPLDCDELICGDSPEAKVQVRELLQKIPGIRWLDGGPLRYCRALEAMTMLVIGLNRRYRAKHGRFKVVGLPSNE